MKQEHRVHDKPPFFPPCCNARCRPCTISSLPLVLHLYRALLPSLLCPGTSPPPPTPRPHLLQLPVGFIFSSPVNRAEQRTDIIESMKENWSNLRPCLALPARADGIITLAVKSDAVCY